MLTKYGKPMTIVRGSAVTSGWTRTFDGGLGTFKWTNDSTGAVVYVDPTTPSVPITYTTVGIEKPFLQKEIDGTVILEGDRRLILAGDVQPITGDTIQVDSATDVVRVQNVTRIAPALVTLAWLVHVRE